MSASKGSTDIKQQRRRLSVMSDNKLIEGIDGVNLEDEVSYVYLYCAFIIDDQLFLDFVD